MTAYARNWTPNRGTNSSKGALRFQAPQRSPRGNTRRRIPFKVARTYLELAKYAGPRRYQFATSLVKKNLDYILDVQPKTVRDFLRDYALDPSEPWAETQPAKNTPGYYDMDGFDHRCTGTSDSQCENSAVRWTTGTVNELPLCGMKYQVFNYAVGDPLPVLDTARRTGAWFRIGPMSEVGQCQLRFDITEAYFLPSDGTRLRHPPVYIPPHVQPAIRMPVPAPLEIEYGRMTNPRRHRPGRLRLRPYELRARQFEPSPSGVGGRISTTVHLLQRPGPRDKEHKMKLKHGLAMKLFGGFTEFQDFTESIAKAVKLPNGRDCRSKDPFKAWACIVANREKLDGDAARRNIIENQIEDFLIGQFGRLGAKSVAKATAGGYYRSPVGWQFGQNWTRTPQLNIEEKK